MNNRRQYLNVLIKRLHIIFWILLVFTLGLAIREFQYLATSTPSSGNWEITPVNSVANNYIYDWVSYINIVLTILAGAVTFTVYLIKKLFEDIRKDN